MPQKPEHPFDSVADEISKWIEQEAPWYAKALVGGYQTPFAAQKVSETDKLAYYRRQMYQQGPDGSIDYTKPNQQGRDALIKRIGVDQYAQVAQATGPGTGIEHIQRLEDNTTPAEDYLNGSNGT